MQSLLRRSAVLALLFTLAWSPSACASEEGEELKAADAQLNAVYKKALAAMPSDDAKAKLKDAQRAWIAFRDAEIALSAELPGSASGNLLKMLQTELTKARTEQLKAAIEASK